MNEIITHVTQPVEETDEHIVYLCPECGYRAKQIIGGGFEVLEPGVVHLDLRADAPRVVHVGMSSQVEGVELGVGGVRLVTA